MGKKCTKPQKDNTDANPTQPVKNLTLKFLVLGELGVGKTSLIQRFVKNQFSDEPAVPGLDDDRYQKTITVDGRNLDLQIWDTTGRESSSTVGFYKGAHAFMITFDLTKGKDQTFQNLERYYQDLERYANDNCPRVIVGTKVDLKSERMISTEQIDNFCKQRNLVFVETSSKDDINVTFAYEKLCKLVLQKGVDPDD
eukprot:TRINITY_DN1167_c0_g1_i1.p2 TRINITY_DN1167_c0_g1~~TRINITY_DN1167_c0_g1_i1.p2  ORF type:complete len:197 (-),score=33.84 TRINITY_DN1167_c0_g1_i1:902-1492(-)